MRNFFLAICFLSIAACGTTWPPASLPTSQEVVASWQQTDATIKMVGEMMLLLPDTQYAAEHSLLISPDGRFRLDMYGPFEKRVFSIVCDGSYILATHYDENRSWFGRATPQNLAKFVGMDLNPRHIYQVLCGSAPFWLSQPQLEQARVMASSNREEVLLMLEGSQSITFRLQDMRILEATLREDDGRLFDISYKRWQQDNNLPLSLELKANDNRGLNIYNDKVWQVEFDANDFKLPPLSPSMRVLNLDAN